jgi:flagellar protein FliS
MKQNYAVYKEIGINTSQPLKLVIMLYDGAITYLNKSIEYAENKDIKNKNIYANKARDIILELNNSLNLEVGGEMASNLKRLYFFMNRHLFQANLKNDMQGMREVILMLSDLREVWQEISNQKENTDHQTYPQATIQAYTQRGIRI